MKNTRLIAYTQFFLAAVVAAALVIENKYLWFIVDFAVIITCSASGIILLKGDKAPKA